MKPNRREFILFPAAAATAAPRLWIDPGLDGVPGRPWRNVHPDFHNSGHISRIGAEFDAEAFGNTPAAAHVNAIVVFAKDMHGYFYYPGAYGPVHPGLTFDLLGEQVTACRKRGIPVYAYYCTAWDNNLARSRPEWLAVRRDGSTYLPGPGETPGWTALCLAHEDFVDLVAGHAREFTARYALDGAWFDMPIPRGGECFCPVCLKRLRDRGADPYDPRVQREDKQALLRAFLKRLRDTVREVRPSCQVDFNNQCVYGLGERAPLQDNIDIEALPTASWGYFSAEITVTHQSARAGRPERYLVHVVNYSPLRRTPRHPEFYEDPAPLADITVRLNLGIRPAAVRAVAAGVSLPASLEAALRRVPVHEIVAFEVS